MLLSLCWVGGNVRRWSELRCVLCCSDPDKAHLRLAAAKGVLRLARRWDSQIPIDVYHMVVMTVQVGLVGLVEA